MGSSREEIREEIKANEKLSDLFAEAVRNCHEHLKTHTIDVVTKTGVERQSISELASLPGFSEGYILGSIMNEIEENSASLEEAITTVINQYRLAP